MKHLKISWVILCYLVLITSQLQAQQYFIKTFVGIDPEGASANLVGLNPNHMTVDVNGNIYLTSNNVLRKIDISTNTIATIAGTRNSSPFNDNVLATEVNFSRLRGVAIDANNNIYLAGDDRIRKIDGSTNMVSTIAGTGSSGFSGDGGLAINAQMNSPEGIALDQNNNFLYVADRNNYRIRKIDLNNGMISTVIGTGVSGVTGDGGFATNAQIDNVKHIAVDAVGNIYFSEESQEIIRKIDVTTKIVNTITGNGTRGFSGDGGNASAAVIGRPQAITIAANGDIYFADSANDRIRVINSSGVINTQVGSGNTGFSGDGGDAKLADFDNPELVVLDKDGNLLIFDEGNNRLRKVATASNNTVTTIAGNGVQNYVGGLDFGDGSQADFAGLNIPLALTLDQAGNLYLSSNISKVRKVNAADSIIQTFAGTNVRGFTGDNNLATNARLDRPDALTTDANSNLYIADRANRRIRKVDANTGIITTIAGDGSATFSGDGGLAINAGITNPIDVKIYGNDLYIADAQDQRIRKVDLNTGIITTVVGTGGSLGGDGGSATSAGIGAPQGLSFDANGNMYIYASSRIRKVDANTNIISTIAGGGTSAAENIDATQAQLSFGKISIDNAGNIYITQSRTIRKINASDGKINTIAGNGSRGYTPGAGLATNARLESPKDLYVDNQGLLYFSDETNGVIYQLIPESEVDTKVASTGIANNGNQSLGDTPFQTNKSLTFTIENSGTFNLYVQNFKASGDFSVGMLPVQTITPGNSLDITVTMDASSAGAKTGTFTFQSNDIDEGLYTINLTGNVLKADQSITFDLGANNTKTFGEADFNLNATTTSGETVTYVSSDANVATITGNTVTIVGVGTANITASQTGNSNYNAATDVTQILTVNKANQTITFELGNNATKVVGDANFNLAASGGASGNTVTFASADTNVATIAGNTVTIVGQGTTTITASQAGNNNYNAAIDVAQTLTVQSTITALPDNLKEGKLIIFPNPVANQLRVKVEGKAGSQRLQISLLNYQGQIVNKGSYQLTNGQINLPVNQLPSGTYLLQIQVGNQTILRKIIKK